MKSYILIPCAINHGFPRRPESIYKASRVYARLNLWKKYDHQE